MIEAIKIWNEPNNLSHWDFELDPEWKDFSEMTILGAREIRKVRPHMPIVLGGMSPIDPAFVHRMQRQGVLDAVDIVAIHGFPLDWNHWRLEEWPEKLEGIQKVSGKPVWITEVGVSSFGADEVQTFGLKKTFELLAGKSERIFWYSLLDLPPAWGATTRHKENEGSSYYRHFYMGLIRHDGTPKPAVEVFDPEMGICQWFHYEDPRLDFAVDWLKRLGVKKLRTGISWADWHRPNALDWFDRQMQALADFDLTITLCFTPPSRGKRPDHTSPPLEASDFAGFARAVLERYVPN
ncbi:MAG TPA: beta-xylosidase [Bdellovibrionales bacterium]|nr:MAG: beta-xylosidase [Bdellovibrionales bacterium GWB1_52_6]OFZ02923.1 MAG: beta-xylosidase [Bdellovibrionales bacterium GWA1_52_35]OFZ40820.1 MAG: beta-xylosidase [Bdellovibrionales bacterium GWC1_52_8]HAR42830.1 beta-xylosidase [Bdellovibrionales bacterium]HCM38506.1 beta-xylosidase [Bdellovibrionales bacterium]